MSKIPIYLKTDAEMPRPTDPAYYLVARDGTFLCRNHTWFKSDIPTSRQPEALAQHAATCRISYPKISAATLEYCVAFFDEVFDRHGSEAIVLLLWDVLGKRYRLWVPEQEPTVWESSRGIRSAMDVSYKAPIGLPSNFLQVGDIHSHADLGATPSYTDRSDEAYRDGIHIIIGHINEEPPEFHQEVVVDGYRFQLKFNQILAGYRRRRRIIPKVWMDRVRVIVKKSTWTNWSANTYDTSSCYGTGGSYESGGYKRDDDSSR